MLYSVRILIVDMQCDCQLLFIFVKKCYGGEKKYRAICNEFAGGHD